MTITTTLDQITDNATTGTITDQGNEIDAISLPATEDQSEWDRLADLAINTAGYHRTSDWEYGLGTLTATVEIA